jgi:hypothetical protein
VQTYSLLQSKKEEIAPHLGLHEGKEARNKIKLNITTIKNRPVPMGAASS